MVVSSAVPEPMLVCCCGREKKKVAAGKITRTEVKKKSSFALGADTCAVRGRVCVGKKKPVIRSSHCAADPMSHPVRVGLVPTNLLKQGRELCHELEQESVTV